MRITVKARLPPLTSLRAFDAVARSSSLRDAATELSLTASAVSHQIRNLEEHLGVALLRRRGRGVELTPAGTMFASHVQRAFGELHHGVRALVEGPDSRTLRVSVTPVFGTEILMPRLTEFERTHPGLRVQLEMSEVLADFSDEPVDVAICAGLPPPASLYSEDLVTVHATPVCSPKLLAGPRPLRRVEDLRAHTLICLSCEPELAGCWERWVMEAGCADLVRNARSRSIPSLARYMPRSRTRRVPRARHSPGAVPARAQARRAVSNLCYDAVGLSVRVPPRRGARDEDSPVPSMDQGGAAAGCSDRQSGANAPVGAGGKLMRS